MSDRPGCGCLGAFAGPAVTLAFFASVPLQLGLCLYLGYTRIYGPMSAAPGARDGMGLILVLGAVAVGSCVATAILAAVEWSLLKRVLPWWEPPDLEP
ncbi:MAG: hypothetical protein IT452_14960 [Planctomycetia bacterium]|nr:hypothetical protein [Planctomycetia bacterium]